MIMRFIVQYFGSVWYTCSVSETYVQYFYESKGKSIFFNVYVNFYSRKNICSYFVLFLNHLIDELS